MLTTDKDWYVYCGLTYCPRCAKKMWDRSGDFAHRAVKIGRIMLEDELNNFICTKPYPITCMGSTELMRIQMKVI